MGRKKISIEYIKDDRARQVTLNKRRIGLMKKMYELSVLCGCEMAFVMFDRQDRHYLFGSHEIGATISRFLSTQKDPFESHTNATMRRLINKREGKGKTGGGDDDDDYDAEDLVAAQFSARKAVTPEYKAQLKQRQMAAFEDATRHRYMISSMQGQGQGQHTAAAAAAAAAVATAGAASPRTRSSMNKNLGGLSSGPPPNLTVQTRPGAAAGGFGGDLGALASAGSGLASAGIRRRKRPGIHVPDSDKPYPPGTMPRRSALNSGGPISRLNTESLIDLANYDLPTNPRAASLHSPLAGDLHTHTLNFARDMFQRNTSGLSNDELGALATPGGDLASAGLPTNFNPLQTPQMGSMADLFPPATATAAAAPAVGRVSEETSVAESLCRMSRSASEATAANADPAAGGAVTEAASPPKSGKRSVTRSTSSASSGKRAKVGGKR